MYDNIQERDITRLLNNLQANTIVYKAKQTIAYSISNRNLIGIIEEGYASLIRFDYDGKRTILEEIKSGDIFSDMFISTDNSELSVVADTDCTVTFIEYENLVEESKTSKTASVFMDNLVKLISHKLVKRNERIEILTRRSIRDKLLYYFESEAKKYNSKTFNLKYTYTDLADYLSVDRSALMRELKNLKDDGIIQDVNKKITILYQ